MVSALILKSCSAVELQDKDLKFILPVRLVLLLPVPLHPHAQG